MERITMKVWAVVSCSYLYVKQCTCLRSCSSPCTGWSHISLRCSWAGSDTWPPDGHWGSSFRRSDIEFHTALRGELWREKFLHEPTFCRRIWMLNRSDGLMRWKQDVWSVCVHQCRLTEWWLGGGRSLHACTVVGHVVVRAGTHRSTGAEQTQPLTLLPVTWVSHWCRETKHPIRKIVWNV